jgi:hypothetical protein
MAVIGSVRHTARRRRLAGRIRFPRGFLGHLLSLRVRVKVPSRGFPGSGSLRLGPVLPQDQYETRRLSASVQRRRRVAVGALALAVIVVVGFVAGHVIGSSSKSSSKASTPSANGTAKPATTQSSSTQAAQAAAQRRARRAAKRRAQRQAQAQAQAQNGGTAVPPSTPPPAATPTPRANTPQGQRQLQQSPDCKNAPPPPKNYKGPVQC